MSNYDSPLIEKQKFESIDILRGIAILMVILVHTSQKIDGNPLLKSFAEYGQMGVQMFFIASAFTLCHSLEFRKSKDEPLFNFYFRRFFRIAPGYYVGIMVYFLINTACNSMDIVSAWKGDYSPLNILVNVLFLNGLYPGANNNIVPGGWSIGTEMLFYLIFPLLFQLYNYLQSRLRYSYLVVPVTALMLSAIIQYGFFKFTEKPLYFSNNSFIYFSLLNQLPVFCIGISLYFAHKKRLLNQISTAIALTLTIVLSSFSGYLMLQGNSVLTFVNAFTPFIAALSFAFLFVLLQNNQFKNTLLVNIGIRSYSCYLLHIIFAYFMVGFLAKRFDFINADIEFIFLYLLTVALTYLLSGFMYKYIEVKGISMGKKIITLTNLRSNNVQADLRSTDQRNIS